MSTAATGQGRPYAELVATQGLSDSHELLLAAIPPGARVLDVGCASGYLAERLAKRGCVVVGIEPDAVNAAAARSHCESVVVGDFEDPAQRSALPGPFDRVIFGDVLEHLRDPWGALYAAKALLSVDGRVVASIPNIAHWSARREILRGKFDYVDHGLFDRTHLRFFTRRTVHELAERSGFVVEHEAHTQWALPLERLVGGHVPKRLRPWAARRWPELFALQFVVTLRSVAS